MFSMVEMPLGAELPDRADGDGFHVGAPTAERFLMMFYSSSRVARMTQRVGERVERRD